MLTLSAFKKSKKFCYELIKFNFELVYFQPESYVDVDRCQVEFVIDDMRCNWPTIITVVTHDQYDDVVQVPNLRVRVLVTSPLIGYS